MKPEQYNPKAREAFGKTLIDIGVSIIKGIFLLLTVVPLGFIIKGVTDESSVSISLTGFMTFLSSPVYLVFLVLLGGGFILGNHFRKEGLRHIHEIENQSLPLLSDE